MSLSINLLKKLFPKCNPIWLNCTIRKYLPILQNYGNFIGSTDHSEDLLYIYGRDPEKLQSTIGLHITLIICFLRNLQEKDLDITSIVGYNKLLELQQLVSRDYINMIRQARASYIILQSGLRKFWKVRDLSPHQENKCYPWTLVFRGHRMANRIAAFLPHNDGI